MPFAGIQFPQHSEPVQLLEGMVQIASAQIGDNGLVCIGFLPPDFSQFSGVQSSVFFQ